MQKLESHKKIDLGDGVEVFIKNPLWRKYEAFSDVIIIKDSTKEEFKTVCLYKQVMDDAGNYLDTPIYDDDDYYYVYPNGEKRWCYNMKEINDTK